MNISDRITFLAKNFDVFENDTKNAIAKKFDDLKDESEDNTVTKVINSKDEIIGFIVSKKNVKDRILINVSIGMSVFSDMIAADPTNNKVCLQWMLNVFTRLLKDGELAMAIRFADEDLPQANDYLKLFEQNKRKQKFINLCKSSYSLKHLKDPTDINQYKSLSQLFDAVDPFIEKEPSAVERTMNKYVDKGEAIIPVKDRKYTVFIPKTTEANVIFDGFANWCTAKAGNGMFKSYTQNNKKPNGKNSDIYIVINNKFFTGESDEIYQIHFETSQVKDRKNGSNVNFFEKVLLESESVSNYFYEELMGMAKTMKSIDKNKYVDQLIEFGFTDCLFDLIDEKAKVIKFMQRNIPKLPDMSKFKSVDQFIIAHANLIELHPSIGGMDSLEMLVLTGNKLKTLPKELGGLKNLEMINISGNRITSIPEEIKYLDRSHGGSLKFVVVNEMELGADNYKRLKELLPETEFN